MPEFRQPKASVDVQGPNSKIYTEKREEENGGEQLEPF